MGGVTVDDACHLPASREQFEMYSYVTPSIMLTICGNTIFLMWCWVDDSVCGLWLKVIFPEAQGISLMSHT